MPDIFVISDTHFDHEGILRFTDKDGAYLRDFKDVNHMNEYMIEKWNSVVRTQDKVYHLGDVGIFKGKNHGQHIARLNGHIRLVLGNHDYFLKHQSFFGTRVEAVYGSRRLDDFLLTHIPIHPLCLGKKITANIHGHVHNNVGPDHFGPRYFNVSVEVIDYTPVSFEDLKKKVLKKIDQNRK